MMFASPFETRWRDWRRAGPERWRSPHYCKVAMELKFGNEAIGSARAPRQ
jgi:hypothetical protein